MADNQQFNFDQQAQEPPVTIDSATGEITYTGQLQNVFDDPYEAVNTVRIAKSLGIQASMAEQNDKYVVTLTDPTETQLGYLERKVKIATWSRNATALANTVTQGVTQLGDYALNGAIAPTATAVANAAFVTARVVGTAGARIALSTGSSLCFNARTMAHEIAQSQELNSAYSEAKACLSEASTALGNLFGIKKGTTNWKPVQVAGNQTAA